jgi:uncharacterized sulfatase
MIRWPGHVKPERSDSLVTSLDIAPTLLAAAKLPPTPQMSGINLLDKQAIAARKSLFGECFTHDSIEPDNPAASLKWRWMIDGHWKLIVPDAENRPKDKFELYDLAADPFEEHNLAAAHDDIVKRMHAAIDAWWIGRPASR